MASILIRLVFAAALLGGGYLLLRSNRLTTELLAGATAEVPGTITGRVESNENVSRRQQGRSLAYRYQFEFTLGGRTHRLSSYETTADREIGEAVRIRYIPAAFEGAGVEDPTWSAYAVEFPPPALPTLRPMLGWIFVVLGGLFLLSIPASLGVAHYLRTTELSGGR